MEELCQINKCKSKMKSGIDTLHFKPNSTHAASTSAAFRKGVPLETIMAVTGLSAECKIWTIHSELVCFISTLQMSLLSYNKHVVLYSRLYQRDDIFSWQLHSASYCKSKENLSVCSRPTIGQLLTIHQQWKLFQFFKYN